LPVTPKDFILTETYWKDHPMTEEKIVPTELSERLCQIVNEILAKFNEKNVTPSEAGTIVLALIHRLMGVLQDNQEVQRAFVTSIIGVVNEHLLGILEGSDSPPCQN
jgi:hypothetical protein